MSEDDDNGDGGAAERDDAPQCPKNSDRKRSASLRAEHPRERVPRPNPSLAIAIQQEGDKGSKSECIDTLRECYSTVADTGDVDTAVQRGEGSIFLHESGPSVYGINGEGGHGIQMRIECR